VDDPFDLQRFVRAQDSGGTWERALAELRGCEKQTHWIWYVLPQLVGLGRSANAERYGITGLDEARAYLAHPVLGRRLRQAVDALLACPGAAAGVLGPDDVKLRSCLTLFARAAPDEPTFRALLERWYGGEEDPRTLALL
jgi:uncharacterized protein (DUF1810 family)